MLSALVLPGFTAGFYIAERVGAKIVRVSEKVFPDGELYIRIEEPEKVAGNPVMVVSTLYPNQLENLFKTLMLIDAARNAGASRLVLYVAYLAYSRQDKIFLPGEPVSACIIARVLKTAGVERLLTVDVHSPRVLECFEGSSVNLVVSDLLVEHAIKYVTNPIIIAPDKGALERASLPAGKLGLEYDYLIKQRDRTTGEITYIPREVKVEGRDVVLVDDIISTGGTIAEASRMLLKNGARRVIVTATHGLFVGNALSKIGDAGVYRIIVADTLLVKHFHPLVEYVDISEKVAAALADLSGST